MSSGFSRRPCMMSA